MDARPFMDASVPLPSLGVRVVSGLARRMDDARSKAEDVSVGSRQAPPWM